MRGPSSISCLLWLAMGIVTTTESFVLPSPRSVGVGCSRYASPPPPSSSRRIPPPSLQRLSSTASSSSSKNTEDDETLIRQEIESMRLEAARRLDALNQQLHEKDLVQEEHDGDKIHNHLHHHHNPPSPAEDDSSDNSPQESNHVIVDELAQLKALEAHMTEDMHSARSSSSSSSSSALLDNTRWRLMLNIGRENNTWMPKTWGVSGERLLMNLELEFTSEQLYEREEFLNGIGGSKVLHVVHNELTMGPNMKEGSKRMRVRDGGWRVANGEGPMGTNVLRFYIEVEEEARHQGSDVHCPAGRVYCTCGYFPMTGHDGKSIHGSMKDELRKKQQELAKRYEELSNENEADTWIVSIDKLKRTKEMMDLRQQADRLTTKLNQVRVREPEKSLLRMSRNQKVGLTREGGVCCKVNKGLAIEYHILGKFEIASIENREHSNYKDLLP